MTLSKYVQVRYAPPNDEVFASIVNATHQFLRNDLVRGNVLARMAAGSDQNMGRVVLLVVYWPRHFIKNLEFANATNQRRWRATSVCHPHDNSRDFGNLDFGGRANLINLDISAFRKLHCSLGKAEALPGHIGALSRSIGGLERGDEREYQGQGLKYADNYEYQSVSSDRGVCIRNPLISGKVLALGILGIICGGAIELLAILLIWRPRPRLLSGVIASVAALAMISGGYLWIGFGDKWQADRQCRHQPDTSDKSSHAVLVFAGEALLLAPCVAPFMRLRRLPELRFDAQFIERLDQAAWVMAEDFSEKLVHLRDRRLGAKARPELGLNHVEGSLDVRPLVVVREELLAAIAEQMERPLPNLGSAVPLKRRRARRVLLKGD